MKYNYHTHTELCFHARGENEDFVLAAIKMGFQEIGFADHSPWNFEDGFVSGMRMHKDEIEAYCKSIKYLREKYKDKISIKLGFECEYFPKYLPWLKEIIEKYEIDYIILGHHFSKDEPGGIYNGNIKRKEDVVTYMQDILDALDTGLFSYVAHPDIYLKTYPEFDEVCEEAARKIILKAIETDTPIEYNLLGLSNNILDDREGYPNTKFWKIAAELGPKVVVGIDAHTPEAYLNSELFKMGYENVKKLGLEVTDKIRFFR